MKTLVFQKILRANPCFQKPKELIPKGIVIHSTATPQKKVDVFTNSATFAATDAKVSVHGFLGLDGAGQWVFQQTLPFNCRAWHVGSGPKGSFNTTHIGYELCCNQQNDLAYLNEMFERAVYLTADFCKQLKIDPANVVGHYEAHQMGYGSNHGDPKDWMPIIGKSMDAFRQEVSRLLNFQEQEEEEMQRYQKLADCPDYSQATLKKLIDGGVLKGNEKGLDLTEDMIRLLVILDRAGKL